VILNFSFQVLHLLAACQNYEMETIGSLIRTKVESGEFPVPVGTETFAAYAIACDKGLIPEMENAARLTLAQPMTFDALGKGLQLFKDQALRDLANFRQRCQDNLVTCLGLYLEVAGPSKIWVGCPEVMSSTPSSEECQQSHALPKWLEQFFSQKLNDLKLHNFAHPLFKQSILWEEGEYRAAFESHDDCNFCLRMQANNGFGYSQGLYSAMRQAIEKVLHSFNIFNIRELHVLQVCCDHSSLFSFIHPSPRNQ
jgi:hypothetical protein